LGLIPARGGSKGIPGKNARPLLGRPLIDYTFTAALRSRRLQRTLLSTDCPHLAQLGRDAGIEVPFMRPADLAADHTPTLPVVFHALNYLESRQRYLPEIVVLLQPTAPLRTELHIDAAIDSLIQSQADALVSVMAVPSHFSPPWQFQIEQGHLRLWDGQPLENITPRRQELPTTYVRNGAIYAIWREALVDSQSFFGRRCVAFVMPQSESINIDTIEDWHSAERFLEARASYHEAG
jgi:CMP-N-acetylneuraminic acid synthetase